MRSHPPCILSLLTIPCQKPRGPASPTWSMGSQALRTHLCSGRTSRATVSTAASSHYQSSQSPVQGWHVAAVLAARLPPSRKPLSCHTGPHVPSRAGLLVLGRRADKAVRGTSYISPGGSPADAEGRGRRLRRGLPGRLLGGTRVPAAQGPAAGPGAARGRGAAGLTLLRCGSRVSR